MGKRGAKGWDWVALCCVHCSEVADELVVENDKLDVGGRVIRRLPKENMHGRLLAQKHLIIILFLS